MKCVQKNFEDCRYLISRFSEYFSLSHFNMQRTVKFSTCENMIHFHLSWPSIIPAVRQWSNIGRSWNDGLHPGRCELLIPRPTKAQSTKSPWSVCSKPGFLVEASALASKEIYPSQSILCPVLFGNAELRSSDARIKFMGLKHCHHIHVLTLLHMFTLKLRPKVQHVLEYV